MRTFLIVFNQETQNCRTYAVRAPNSFNRQTISGAEAREGVKRLMSNFGPDVRLAHTPKIVEGHRIYLAVH